MREPFRNWKVNTSDICAKPRLAKMKFYSDDECFNTTNRVQQRAIHIVCKPIVCIPFQQAISLLWTRAMCFSVAGAVEICRQYCFVDWNAFRDGQQICHDRLDITPLYDRPSSPQRRLEGDSNMTNLNSPPIAVLSTKFDCYWRLLVYAVVLAWV